MAEQGATIVPPTTSVPTAEPIAAPSPTSDPNGAPENEQPVACIASTYCSGETRIDKRSNCDTKRTTCRYGCTDGQCNEAPETAPPVPTSTPVAAAPKTVASPTPIPTFPPTLNLDIAEQREVLIALYEATDGANWTNKENWLTDEPLGKWYGVTVDQTQRVVELVLPENNLSGEIPPELGSLAQLEVLHLPDNQLSGKIPQEIGDLANLKRLWLSRNELTGEIPPELGRLISLERLWLTDNRLTGQIPPELVNLTNLTILQIHLNQLSGNIPAELGNLTGLQLLTLNSNELTGAIPAELGNLTNLKELRLGGNQLGGCVPIDLQDQLTNDPGMRFCPTLVPFETIISQLAPPPYVKWDVGSEVSEEDLQYAQAATRLMHDYAVSRGMLEVKEEVTFHLYRNEDDLMDVYERVTGRNADWLTRGSTAVADGTHVFINVSSQSFEPREPKYRLKISAHELFHVYQHILRPEKDNKGPTWNTEGVAEFFAYKALDAGGVLDYDEERTNPWGFVERGKVVDVPLKEMETHAGFSKAGGDAYRFLVLPAQLLASYRGEEALLRYYQLLQLRTTWQEAFLEAFGMPVEEFYIFFEEHRAAGFPETSTYVSGHPNFIFGPDADDNLRRQIMDDIHIIHGWFADDIGIDISGITDEITVFVFGQGFGRGNEHVHPRRLDAFIAFREDLTPEDRDRWRDRAVGQGSGWGHLEHPMVCNCGPARSRLSLAHELTHVVQGNLSDGWRQRPPVWLYEGMAEHLSRVMAAERGMEKCTPRHCNGVGSFNDFLLAALDHPPLETQETRDGLAGLRYGYASGMVASAILAEMAGYPSLMEFFSLIGQGRDWQGAFQTAFGMTVSEFYELFERSRVNGFPEIPSKVRQLP